MADLDTTEGETEVSGLETRRECIERHLSNQQTCAVAVSIQ